MNIISITDFRNNIGTYIDKVIYNDETFFLKKGKSVVAKIVKNKTEEKTFNKKAKLLELAGIWKDTNTKEYEKILEEIKEKSKREVRKIFRSYDSN